MRYIDKHRKMMNMIFMLVCACVSCVSSKMEGKPKIKMYYVTHRCIRYSYIVLCHIRSRLDFFACKTHTP